MRERERDRWLTIWWTSKRPKNGCRGDWSLAYWWIQTCCIFEIRGIEYIKYNTSIQLKNKREKRELQSINFFKVLLLHDYQGWWRIVCLVFVVPSHLHDNLLKAHRYCSGKHGYYSPIEANSEQMEKWSGFFHVFCIFSLFLFHMLNEDCELIEDYEKGALVTTCLKFIWTSPSRTLEGKIENGYANDFHIWKQI